MSPQTLTDLPIGLIDAKTNLWNGPYLLFRNETLTMRIWGSSFTGKEVIAINDAVVSSKYSWRFNTWHSFDHGEDHYEVLIMLDIQGRISALVLQGDRVVFRGATPGIYSAKNPPESWKTRLIGLAVAFAGGFSGYFAMKWLLDQLFGAS